MALPVNKKTLDTQIETELASNSTQAITAAVLRNTLTPIVNSTFGLKTIWAGKLSVDFTDGYTGPTNAYRGYVSFIENYYDPNYLPANTGAALSDISNRYRVINFGSGANTIGTHTGVQTTVATIDGITYGQGLTFTVTIGTGGILTALSVENPGSGYLAKYGGKWGGGWISPLITLLVPGSGIRPTIQLSMQGVLNITESNAFDRRDSGYFLSKFYFILPNANTLLKNTSEIIFEYTDTSYKHIDSGAQSSLYVAKDTNTFVNNNQIECGIVGMDLTNTNDNSKHQYSNGILEIKVPIINTITSV